MDDPPQERKETRESQESGTEVMLHVGECTIKGQMYEKDEPHLRQRIIKTERVRDRVT